MASLFRHNQVVDPEQHARLGWRADCPWCLATRHAGRPPETDLLTRRQKAGLMAATIGGLLSLPGTAVAGGSGLDPDTVAKQALNPDGAPHGNPEPTVVPEDVPPPPAVVPEDSSTPPPPTDGDVSGTIAIKPPPGVPADEAPASDPEPPPTVPQAPAPSTSPSPPPRPLTSTPPSEPSEPSAPPVVSPSPTPSDPSRPSPPPVEPPSTPPSDAPATEPPAPAAPQQPAPQSPPADSPPAEPRPRSESPPPATQSPSPPPSQAPSATPSPGGATSQPAPSPRPPSQSPGRGTEAGSQASGDSPSRNSERFADKYPLQLAGGDVAAGGDDSRPGRAPRGVAANAERQRITEGGGRTRQTDDGAASARPDSDDASTYTVKAGDCLWFIAERQLADGATDADIAAEVNRLWQRNAEIIATGDPNLIYPGQVLRL